jgi:hypothetical protein
MKIIYLDQFVLQKAFCPSSRDKHRDFFVQVGELCLKLADKQVAAFPFCESHLNETALQLDQAKREAIVEKFEAISNGYQFCPAQGIRQLQAFAVRKGLPIDWSANRVVFHHGLFGFREKLSATIIPDRALHHAEFKKVLLQFQNATDAKLNGIANREAQAYGELLTKDLAARMVTGTTPDLLSLIASPHFRLWMELEMEMRADGVADSLMEAYRFVCERVMEVPCIRLETELWEHFVKARRKALADENDPASTVEDIRFVSCFVPYCDAAFLEIKMTTWLGQSKLLAGHKTALFSLAHHKDKFIQYLSGLENDHVNPVSLKTFAAFEMERLVTLRQHNCPLLWICFIPTHPDDLVLSKIVNPENSPDSLIECRILPGGGIEWVEAIPDIANISSDQLESLIQRALDRLMAVPREGCHVEMRVNYSLANCAGLEIKSHSGSQSKKIETDLFGLGSSDWLTDGRDLLWPKPDEILTALFQSKSPKPRAKGRRISAALSGLG